MTKSIRACATTFVILSRRRRIPTLMRRSRPTTFYTLHPTTPLLQISISLQCDVIGKYRNYFFVAAIGECRSEQIAYRRARVRAREQSAQVFLDRALRTIKAYRDALVYAVDGRAAAVHIQLHAIAKLRKAFERCAESQSYQSVDYKIASAHNKISCFSRSIPIKSQYFAKVNHFHMGKFVVLCGILYTTI